MVLRDKATRNLDNIKFAKEKSGRVPAGMQTPKVLGNNNTKFQQSWAQALKEAEEILSTCIEEHLTEYIETIDQVICAGCTTWSQHQGYWKTLWWKPMLSATELTKTSKKEKERGRRATKRDLSARNKRNKIDYCRYNYLQN